MWKRIKRMGSERGDSPELRLQKLTVLIISIGCCMAAPLWSFIYLSVGMYLSAIGPVIYLVSVVPAIIYFAYTKNEKPLINIQLFSIFLCPTIMQWTAGGFVSGGVVILWALLAPLSALLFHDIRKARLWFGIFIACVLATALFNDFLTQFGKPVSQRYATLLLTMNIAGPSLVIYFTMQYFVYTLMRNGNLLLLEKQKTDKLLQNILPLAIAEELKKTGRVHPMKYSSSTVIFSDFKDFTKISELLGPEQLVDELDICFRAFDEIITSYGLEKIKTIGDAYMCVSGVPNQSQDGTVNAISAALQMAHYIEQMKAQRKAEGKPYWNVRIGIHTGEVVAGIVGKNKFAYDVWGDTVNTASRMETSSEPGKINISGTTYELIKDHFNCTYRGKIPAKNKGIIDMYFVDGALN